MKNERSRAAQVLLAVAWSTFLFLGCDYVPRTLYEIETKDGNTLKLLCPTVDRNRSKLTYTIEGQCVAIKEAGERNESKNYVPNDF